MNAKAEKLRARIDALELQFQTRVKREALALVEEICSSFLKKYPLVQAVRWMQMTDRGSTYVDRVYVRMHDLKSLEHVKVGYLDATSCKSQLSPEAHEKYNKLCAQGKYDEANEALKYDFYPGWNEEAIMELEELEETLRDAASALGHVFGKKICVEYTRNGIITDSYQGGPQAKYTPPAPFFDEDPEYEDDPEPEYDDVIDEPPDEEPEEGEDDLEAEANAPENEAEEIAEAIDKLEDSGKLDAVEASSGEETY